MDSLVPPAEERFPAYPASWYLFCPGEELRHGPVSKRILGRQLVAFRTERGRFAVMDAHCAHLGADLGYGAVKGETIQCPFHHWRFGCDGVCVEGSESAAPLQAYPIEERHGYLFFFNGPEPLFPLPFFFGEDPDQFVAGQPFRYVSDCTWYMNSANGFDMQHFLCVHGRELLAPCEVDCPDLFARRNRYRASIVGDGWTDRLLRRWIGSTVEVSITSWGGPYMLMTAVFPRAQSHFLIATQPIDNGQTLCEGIVFMRRNRNPLWRSLSLRVRGWLTYHFVADEARTLRGIRYNPAGLGSRDREMIEFFQWAASLPQSASSATSTREMLHVPQHQNPA
ncbi:MAG TPA: Rieske 2Fe-2S domain-containing protein [Thermoanaerobaculia bacterium]|jgi:nitrite reductase/ring-hydroxylating ferredoxin subunit|nr:Rieske 2Fe-2S domain-containing protein [Thermoanaerobaculia bacterium]